MHRFDIGARQVGDGAAVYVIAEAGINHDGDLELAERMIRAAASAGVDAVKFQSFTAEGIMTRDAGSAAHVEAGAGSEPVYEFARRIQLSRDAHFRLARACRSAGVAFLSTAGTPDGVELLESVDVPAHKVASMDIDNLELLEAVGATRKPVILSTGMATLAEVERALDTLARAGSDHVVVLHCTSLYPPQVDDVNLRAMDTLRDTLDVPVGYSDHTLGNAVCLAAVARGACMLEKHFTYDRTLPGPDQAISATPEQIAALVSDAREIQRALGHRRKRPVAPEWEMRRNFRRSIVTRIDVPAGARITEEMICFKRPGSGISPADVGWILGRTTRVDLEADRVIDLKDLV